MLNMLTMLKKAMPSPSTPRRSSQRRDNNNTPTKSKPVDVGTPLGPYDTNSVRDRVRQWQAQGGGVITASDILVDDEDEEPTAAGTRKCADTGKQTPAKSTDGDTDGNEASTSKKRNGRRKSRVEDKDKDRDRSGSAPRKRVVSDGHWRKKRSPPRRAATGGPGVKSASSTPRSTLPDDGIRVRAIPEEAPEANPGRKSATKAHEKRSGVGHDGIRVYVTPPSSRRPSEHLRPPGDGASGSRSGDNSDAERAGSNTTPSPLYKTDPSTREKERSPRLGSSAAREDSNRRKNSRRKDATVERSPKAAQGAFSEGINSAKSRRVSILSQVFDESKRIFSKPEPVPIQPPRIPSIEAWLNETPDPFVDGQDPPIEIPAPLSTGSREKKVLQEEAIPEDPNKIWDALDSDEPVKSSGNGSGSRRRRRVRSSALYEDNPFPKELGTALPLDSSKTTSAAKLVDLVQDSTDFSAQTLKRRGAKRAIYPATKDEQTSALRKESFTKDEDLFTVASSRSASSVEPCNLKFSLRPPGLNLKRPFPSTGVHRLSTIASVETFQTRVDNAVGASEISNAPPIPTQTCDDIPDSEAGDTFDPDSLLGRQTSLKRRLTTHADLISVLSLPRRGSKSIQSARSIRTNRSRLATATIGDLMKELSSDECKYMRELRTLVDGVIPVLLTCVLSRSDSAVAAGLFSPSASASNDPNLTRPIMDMGIALERLKALHKRIPQQDSRALLTWAQGAQRVYAEYIKAWRLGFQDVVVNLAPAVEEASAHLTQSTAQDENLDDGLPRNKDGDVVNGDGERVDVAFLLKRPMVRLKYLAKTLKGINFIMPSTEADTLATKYQNMVVDARHRLNEERARLEDEAAANIDPTRARDPRTLAPLIGVIIDRTRRVRARDYFNLALQHSSGQRVDCRVELLLRDDAPDKGNSGDLLICEVDSTGRWLLFPPVQWGRVSARNGDLKGEIVAMVRGLHSQGQEWQELIMLRTDEEAVGFEWVQMLGLTPIPPKVTRTQSFVDRQERRKLTAEPASLGLVPLAPATPGKSRTPSPREMEIPIGEQARSASKTWTPMQEKSAREEPMSPVSIHLKERARLHKSQKSISASAPSTPLSSPPKGQADLRTPQSQSSEPSEGLSDLKSTPRSIDDALISDSLGSGSGLRRVKADRRSRHGDESLASPQSARSSYFDDTPKRLSQSAQKMRDADIGSRVRISPDNSGSKNSEVPSADRSPNARSDSRDGPEKTRPSHHRRHSSVPSLELPNIPKIRKDSPPTTPITSPIDEPEWPVPSAGNETTAQSPSKLRKRRPEKQDNELKASTRQERLSPAHRSPSPVQLKQSTTPNLGSPNSAQKSKRRSSSPLKHEYEPSTASESSSDSEASTVEHHEATSVSDSSSEEELEDGDAPTPLLPMGALRRVTKVSPQGSLYSLPNGTLTPSQSASQAPYKTVPPQPAKATKTIASIFSWSDKGTWESLHPDECSIVITPGLVEAFEMSAAHSKPVTTTDRSETDSELSSISQESERPLIGLELTPLVPLRRGTALDISVRSPPTPNSKITSSTNIMFRSRNTEECEALYALFNHSRINNPTYIALQNARGPYSESYSAVLNRRSSARGNRGSSWFGWGTSKSSYRASSAPTPSIAPSESSIGTMTSAFSALKRFSSGGRMFNISRSTLTSRNGSRSNSIYSTSTSSGASSPVASIDAAKGSPIGISNAKIRLYQRETASKWRDMGSARLTIMQPVNLSHPPSSPSGLSKAHGHTGQEKRILINGKTKGEVLLDVCLGESCFERVARTGIALSVWEEVMGPNGEVGMVGAVGGVGGTRARVYMIQ
ncbi:MAG: hypothetical protein M1830_010657, partial [Pleopsidium flavum]